MKSTNCHFYTFQHKKTGRKFIAQSWNEFYEFQSNKDYFQFDYTRLGSTSFKRFPFETTGNLERKINKFWEGAKGYELCGFVDTMGTSGNPYRIFLRNIHNHACMQGDKETMLKAKEMDKWFWHDYNFSRLLLN